MNYIHRSTYGTYHADPNSDVAWMVNDTRGYTDPGPSCDECNACECWSVNECDCECDGSGVACNPDSHLASCEYNNDDMDSMCIGLSFAYVCLDGGDALCQNCFDKDSDVEVVACNCP